MSTRFVLPFADVGSGISPSSGAKLFFTITGTSTDLDTFSDNALTTANANPVVADSTGVFSDIFLGASSIYKVILKDKNNVQIWEADPVSGSAILTELDTIAAMTAVSGPTNGDKFRVHGYTALGDNQVRDYRWDSSSTATANGGTIIAHDTITPGRFISEFEVVTAKDFGATGDGSTDDFSDISSADTAMTSSGNLTFTAGTYKVSTNLTLTARLIFENGAKLKPDTGVTITINGPINAGFYEIFDKTALGTIAGLVKADNISDSWFGAASDRTTDDAAAVTSATGIAANRLNSADVNRNTFHDVDLGGKILKIDSKTLNSRASKYQSSCLPRLMRKLEEYDESTTPVINIVGMGSSVGNGATLPSPTTQAPVIKFGEYFEEKFNKLGYLSVTTTNRSVDGSTISESLAKFDAIVAEPIIPDILVLAYGMNDGQTAIFNSGQTYPEVYETLVELIEKARAQDCDVVIMTTPHPHTDISWSMPGGVPQTYPTAVSAPVSDAALIPTAAASFKTVDALGYGTGNEIEVSHRHYRVNEAMRRVSVDMGVPLIDVERYWFEAIYSNGEDDLFDTSETVHPNLAGHTRSYWLGIYEFIEALTESAQLGTQQNYLFGPKVGVNKTIPTAVIHAKQLATGDSHLKLEDFGGTVFAEVDSSGNLTYENKSQFLGALVRQKKNNVFPSPTFATTLDREIGQFVNVGTLQNVVTVDKEAGTITVSTFNSGTSPKTQLDIVGWTNEGGTVSLGATTINIGGTVVATIGVSGNNITITPAQANSNINYVLETLVGV